MNLSVLILCTGNSCRSQMAEGYLKSLDINLIVHSGGTRPEKQVNPMAVLVMKEIGIDISGNTPTHVDEYIDRPFDYVITVCDNAKESCPVFTGKVGERLHIGFDDPAAARGTFTEVLAEYRRVRDEIAEAFGRLYKKMIS